MTQTSFRRQTRNFLIVLFFVLSQPFKSNGQNKRDSSDNIFYGIEISPAGLSRFISTFNQQPDREFFDYKSDYSLSFYGGVFFQKKIHKKLLLESGLLISKIYGRESYKYQDTYSDPSVYTYTYWYFDTKSLVKKLTYIHLPILFGINNRKFNFLFGMQIGYNISSKVIQEESLACYGSQKQVCESFNGTIKSNVSKFEIGLIGKITLRLNKRWNTGVRFAYELNKNNKTWNYYNVNLLFSYNLNK